MKKNPLLPFFAAASLFLSATSAHAALVAHYDFENDFGNISGNDYMLTPGTSAMLKTMGLQVTTSGKSLIKGSAVFMNLALFPEAGDTLTTNFGSALNTGSMSISFWVNNMKLPESGANYLSFGESASSCLTLVGTQTPGGASIDFKAIGKTAPELAGSTNGYIQSSKMNHVVLTLNASAGLAALYINNTLANSGAWNLSTDVNTFTLGNLIDGGGAPGRLRGGVDELQIYDSPLSASDVAFLYMNPTAVAPIPEPSTYAFSGIIAGAAALLALRRRKHARAA